MLLYDNAHIRFTYFTQDKDVILFGASIQLVLLDSKLESRFKGERFDDRNGVKENLMLELLQANELKIIVTHPI